MKLYEAKNIITDVFENAFDKDKYAYFVKNLLKKIEPKHFIYTGNIIPNTFQDYIRKFERIGKFEDEEGNITDVLIVELNRNHSIEYARTTQRNFIRWYLNGSRGNEFKDAALVAFHTQKSSDWRFSLIKMQYSLEKGKDELTPARRSSFLVGEKGKSHTAQQQLVGLLKNDNPPCLSDLENAFNIEAVSDEFYEKYRALLFNLADELDIIFAKDRKIKTEFENKNIDTLNFAKKLLGQIVFLYFLQKKGWLGLAENQNYGAGDHNFMRTLFENIKTGENFFNDYLEFLFYDALSKKRKTDFYVKFNCRIPFLNGGLFDPIKFYDWQNTDIVIPNELFSNRRGDKEGSGILDVFDLYNFTVKEDEPLDTEVAIDPEMLGKVFERMLEVRERKSKGAFYTPREIVHYMAQSSLLYYLDATLNQSATQQIMGSSQTELFGNSVKKQPEFVEQKNNPPVPKKDLEILIHYGEHIIDKDIAIDEGRYTSDKNTKHQIPESIRINAVAIDKALDEIKICDPAVGSGAFPVGVMNEIVKLRLLITPFIRVKKNRSAYNFKANAIENSIYGVDIDAGAVEIAKLRLWLSMVVDEERIDNIDPLPNLEYKIVKGNSLLGYPYKPQGLAELEKLKEQYFHLTDKEAKQAMKKQIDTKINHLFKNTQNSLGYQVDFDFQINFSEVKGFDVVIGNPPYVSTKGTNATSKKALKTIYGFADDLYNHFFFKSFDILKRNGTLGFITSNTFLTIGTKANLRKLLQSKKIIEIIKTDDVFDAMVSPAITLVKNINEPNNYPLVFKNAISDFNNPIVYNINIDTFRNAVNSVFFPPTQFNLNFYNIFNKQIKQLHNAWWPKIETSKKITLNSIVLENYRKNLKPGELALLGTLTAGGVGLQTANNGRFVGVREKTKQAIKIKKSQPIKLFEAVKNNKIPLNIKNKIDAENCLNKKSETEIIKLFDELKEKYGRDIFGQGYLYRIIFNDEIADVETLTDEEKKNGIPKDKPHFVPYDKGDKDGNRWYLETPFLIDWSKETVNWFYANSGKKGQGMPVVRNPQFYFRKGFCWTDVNSTYLKCRVKEKGVHDVLSMSLFSKTQKIPEFYIISLINSKFVSEYVDDFVNNTSHFQINDARQLPVIIPSEEQLEGFKDLFNRAFVMKMKQFAGTIEKNSSESELEEIQQKLDEMVFNLYGLSGASHSFSGLKNR